MVLALRVVFCVYLSTESDFLIDTFSVCITVVESVYSAVRTDSLYKAGYVWSLEVCQVRYSSSFLVDLVYFDSKFPKRLAELTVLKKINLNRFLLILRE